MPSAIGGSSSLRPFTPNFANRQASSSFYVFQPRPAAPSKFPPTQGTGEEAAAGGHYDGKRLRKAVARKTVDYNSAVLKMLEYRLWQRDPSSLSLQPDIAYYTQVSDLF